MNNQVALTLDVDWAPDFAIGFVADQLIEHQIKATWFVTHTSPAIERLQLHPELFELGIHPNFLPGSSHGDTPEAVLRHCMDLIPTATSVRTHALFQSSPLLELIMRLTPVRADTSLFLPNVPALRSFEYQWHRRVLLRIPYYWDDDYHMDHHDAQWELEAFIRSDEGLKVFAFHPIHVYLNSSNIKAYQALKEQTSNLADVTPEIARSYIQPGMGTQTLFLELVRYLKLNRRSATINEIYLRWCEQKNE